MRKKILTFALVCTCLGWNFSSQAQSAGSQIAGPLHPSAVSNSNPTCSNCVGSKWNNLQNAESYDGKNAKAFLQKNGSCPDSNCYYSRSLIVAGFGFMLPPTATVLGVKVGVFRNYSVTAVIVDTIVQLTLDLNSAQGNNYALTKALWGVTSGSGGAGYVYYGGATDLWGIPSLTVQDVNSASFGVHFAAKNTSAKDTVSAEVDDITISVTYSTPTGIQTQVRNSSDFSVFNNKLDNTLDVVFNLPANSNPAISVYNITGQVESTSALGFMTAGNYTQKINKGNLAPGIYLVKLYTESREMIRKVLIQ